MLFLMERQFPTIDRSAIQRNYFWRMSANQMVYRIMQLCQKKVQTDRQTAFAVLI